MARVSVRPVSWRLLLSDAVVIGFSCSTITSCHPRTAGLCSALVDLAIRICPQPSHDRHSGGRCYRASWMVAVTQGPFHRKESPLRTISKAFVTSPESRLNNYAVGQAHADLRTVVAEAGACVQIWSEDVSEA